MKAVTDDLTEDYLWTPFATAKQRQNLAERDEIVVRIALHFRSTALVVPQCDNGAALQQFRSGVWPCCRTCR